MDQNVEFESDINNASPARFSASNLTTEKVPSGIAGWLVRRGIAKDARMATLILVVIIAANFMVIYWAWRSSASPSSPSAPPLHVQKDIPSQYIIKPSR